MNLYLIRHGRQNSTLCNVDVPLAEEGKMQGDLLGKRLEKYHIDAIYSSDLLRAIETAKIINKHLGVTHVIKKELREISFGQLTGKSNDDIQKEFANFFREQDKLINDIPYPGGENGEDVCNRMYPVIQNIAKSEYKNVVIVTHGNAIRAILTKILGIEYSKKPLFANTLENCSITQLKYVRRKDRFYLERLNDYAHLEDREELLRKTWI